MSFHPALKNKISNPILKKASQKQTQGQELHHWKITFVKEQVNSYTWRVHPVLKTCVRVKKMAQTPVTAHGYVSSGLLAPAPFECSKSLPLSTKFVTA